MKIVARILLILAVAGAVVGISMALMETKGARASAAPAQVQSGDTNAQTGNPDGEQRRGGGPGGFERGSGRSPNLFGAGELLKDLIIIALIVAIIAPIARLLGRLRSGSEKQPNADTPTSD
jgi:hypothetical protein